MDIKGLREKCQATRRSRDTWYGANFARRVSIYITMVFVRMGIGATAASTVFMLSGIAAASLFSLGGRGGFLAGALALQLFYVLDHVDGEVARYNEDTSLTGKYYDELTHYIVHPLVFFGAGWGLFRQGGSAAYIAAGMLAGLGVVLVNIIIDLKNLMLLRNFHRHGDPSGFANAGNKAGGESGSCAGRNIFSKVDLICHFVTIMNVLTVSAFADAISGARAVAWAVSFYAVFLNAVWILKAAVFIARRKIDSSWETRQFK